MSLQWCTFIARQRSRLELNHGPLHVSSTNQQQDFSPKTRQLARVHIKVTVKEAAALARSL